MPVLHRGPGSGRALGVRAAVAVLALVTSGCALSHPKDEGGNPQRNLAVRPSSLAPTTPPGSTASGSPSASATASRGPGASAPASASRGASASASAGSSAAPEAPYHGIGSVSDRSGDAGATTPGYADIVSVTIEDNGTNARLTVYLRSTIPATLPSDETMGVGVDLYKSVGEIESDYQVFADGEPSGWYAYLDTPNGKVRYPGTFGLGGNRMQFTLPWSALGGMSGGYFAGFADWTRAATPANLSGEDHAPDLTSQPFRR